MGSYLKVSSRAEQRVRKDCPRGWCDSARILLGYEVEDGSDSRALPVGVQGARARLPAAAAERRRRAAAVLRQWAGEGVGPRGGKRKVEGRKEQATATPLFHKRSVKIKAAVSFRQLFSFFLWKVHILLFILDRTRIVSLSLFRYSILFSLSFPRSPAL